MPLTVVEYDGATWTIDTMNDEYCRLYPSAANSRAPVVVSREAIETGGGEIVN